MYILLLFHFVRSCSVLLRSPARDRLVRPVDDHPLVVVRPSRGGHRRGLGLVGTYRLHVPKNVPTFHICTQCTQNWVQVGYKK